MAQAVRGNGEVRLSRDDTIFAIATGEPPAAIAIMRVSGPLADDAIVALAGDLPPSRRAVLRRLRDGKGSVLDDAVVLRFAGDASPTGEPVAEFHIHGGRAVADAVADALTVLPGFREALPGEFTRRSFANGRIDLVQAEGLADLLAAETQAERRNALAMADGHISKRISSWAERATALSAQMEATIDFADEDEIDAISIDEVRAGANALASELANAVRNPTVERLREGPLIVLAGPPNTGKSSLFNALIGRDAAIVTSQAGTTRDSIEAAVTRAGRPYRLVDTAGMRDVSDEVERIGISRAQAYHDAADVVLWLGDGPAQDRGRSILVQSRCDQDGRGTPLSQDRLLVSARTGAGFADLWSEIEAHTRHTLMGDSAALNRRQSRGIATARDELAGLNHETDPVLVAEHLRSAASCLQGLLGRVGIDQTLDAIFGRFCLGK